MNLIQLMILASVSCLGAGCYKLQPAAGIVPESGTKVAFDINDAGRAALGGSMGPELLQVSGTLIDKQGTDYVVAVSGVKLLRGGHQAWNGETVRINSDHVSTLYNRHFSTTRTLLLAGVAVGAAALLSGKALPRGSVDPDPEPIDTAVSRRGRPVVGRLHHPFLRRPNPLRSY
ncbi:MAG: hypothetical protein ABIR92_01725 [Gemmatimonadaceae bacterium]